MIFFSFDLCRMFIMKSWWKRSITSAVLVWLHEASYCIKPEIHQTLNITFLGLQMKFQCYHKAVNSKNPLFFVLGINVDILFFISCNDLMKKWLLFLSKEYIGNWSTLMFIVTWKLMWCLNSFSLDFPYLMEVSMPSTS